MKETKLVCDIMSTICCFVKNNPNEEQTIEHLSELFQSFSLQNVNVDMVLEHMQILKSLINR